MPRPFVPTMGTKRTPGANECLLLLVINVRYWPLADISADTSHFSPLRCEHLANIATESVSGSRINPVRIRRSLDPAAGSCYSAPAPANKSWSRYRRPKTERSCIEASSYRTHPHVCGLQRSARRPNPTVTLKTDSRRSSNNEAVLAPTADKVEF